MVEKKGGLYKDVQSSNGMGIEMKYIFSGAHSSQVIEVGVLLEDSISGIH